MTCDHHHQGYGHNHRNVTLPEDIVGSQILTRLPVKSLFRFRSVCRSWDALISSPRFFDTRLQLARKSPRLLIMHIASFLHRDINFYTYNQEGRRRRTAGLLSSTELPKRLLTSWSPPHANGLLLLATVDARLFVCNPTTGECLLLPNGSHNVRLFQRLSITAGFGFLRSINKYKVARHFYRSYDHLTKTWSMGFEVLTLGIDSSWRATKEVPPYPLDGSNPMSVGKSVYFRIDRSLLHTSSLEAFVSFDLSNENFGVICLPPDLADAPTYEHMGFMDLEGDTCFVNLSQEGTKFDLWLIEDCMTKYKWKHMFSIDLLRPACSVFPVARLHGKLLLHVKGEELDKLEYYNPQSKSLEPAVDLTKDLAYYNPQRQQCSLFQPKTDEELAKELGYYYNPDRPGRFLFPTFLFVVIPYIESFVCL